MIWLQEADLCIFIGDPRPVDGKWIWGYPGLHRANGIVRIVLNKQHTAPVNVFHQSIIPATEPFMYIVCPHTGYDGVKLFPYRYPAPLK